MRQTGLHPRPARASSCKHAWHACMYMYEVSLVQHSVLVEIVAEASVDCRDRRLVHGFYGYCSFQVRRLLQPANAQGQHFALLSTFLCFAASRARRMSLPVLRMGSDSIRLSAWQRQEGTLLFTAGVGLFSSQCTKHKILHCLSACNTAAVTDHAVVLHI